MEDKEVIKDAPVCVLCGRPWLPSVKNRCECGGFCTWGKAKGEKPASWHKSRTGKGIGAVAGLPPDYVPNPPPKEAKARTK
jgi:hypothetical protein